MGKRISGEFFDVNLVKEIIDSHHSTTNKGNQPKSKEIVSLDNLMNFDNFYNGKIQSTEDLTQKDFQEREDCFIKINEITGIAQEKDEWDFEKDNIEQKKQNPSYFEHEFNQKLKEQIQEDTKTEVKKKKKLPFLAKKFINGYLKFFDFQKNFGFMNTLKDAREIFVFGKEFEKRSFSKHLITSAIGNPKFVFRFKVLYYQGTYGESQKVVEMRLIKKPK